MNVSPSPMTTFQNQFATRLPETYGLLISGGLFVHPAVSRMTLHGSRGLAGGCRPDSDIDLSLLLDPGAVSAAKDLVTLLRDVLRETLMHWRGPVELDLAAIFETRGCALKCFEVSAYDARLCDIGGLDCFGLYKVQGGFDGFVANAGVEVRRMYPCLEIWRRA
jgi:hypothetical protein